MNDVLRSLGTPFKSPLVPRGHCVAPTRVSTVASAAMIVSVWDFSRSLRLLLRGIPPNTTGLGTPSTRPKMGFGATWWTSFCRCTPSIPRPSASRSSFARYPWARRRQASQCLVFHPSTRSSRGIQINPIHATRPHSSKGMAAPRSLPAALTRLLDDATIKATWTGPKGGVAPDFSWGAYFEQQAREMAREIAVPRARGREDGGVDTEAAKRLRPFVPVPPVVPSVAPGVFGTWTPPSIMGAIVKKEPGTGGRVGDVGTLTRSMSRLRLRNRPI